MVLIDIGMIWRMATPSAVDRQKQDGTPYKPDYVQKVSSIVLARHSDAERIVSVNDPYDVPYSTEDERDLRYRVLDTYPEHPHENERHLPFC